MFELEKKSIVVLSSNNGCGKCTSSGAGCAPSNTNDQNGKIKSATSTNKSIPNKQC